MPYHIIVHNLTYTPQIDPRMAAETSSYLMASVLLPPVYLPVIYPRSTGKWWTLDPKGQ